MKTLAFVIGNDNYYEGFQLRNALNDARGIQEVFTRLGYDVYFYENITSKMIISILTLLEDNIKQYDATILYYSGHALQDFGENYLVTTDCQLYDGHKAHYDHYCLKLSDWTSILEKFPEKVNIMILDACRRNLERGINQGLTPIAAPQGTLIAYSTSPGHGAYDSGMENHSVYTGALLQYIGQENLSLETLFKKVRKTVYNLTEGKQITWEHTSLIGDFYFNKGQMIYNINIPYDENVVKDAGYKGTGKFGRLIAELKSYNWYRQDPAFDEITSISAKELDKNQQFILGRNILQTSCSLFKAIDFCNDLGNNLIKYNDNNENHVLNGILFEIYFDSHGEIRQIRKNAKFERILNLRNDDRFTKSFEFIQKFIAVH